MPTLMEAEPLLSCEARLVSLSPSCQNTIETGSTFLCFGRYDAVVVTAQLGHNLIMSESLLVNPIIPGFAPDPSIYRIEDTFFLVGYVLRALGNSDENAHSSIWFGIGRFTTEAEIDYALKAVRGAC